MAQFVREGRTTTHLAGDAKSASPIGYAADIFTVAENQVYKVRPDPSAQGVHPVPLAIRRIPEPVEIDLGIPGLGIRVSGPVHQDHAVVHPASVDTQNRPV